MKKEVPKKKYSLDEMMKLAVNTKPIKNKKKVGKNFTVAKRKLSAKVVDYYTEPVPN